MHSTQPVPLGAIEVSISFSRAMCAVLSAAPEVVCSADRLPRPPNGGQSAGLWTEIRLPGETLRCRVDGSAATRL
jgi:hypothetical protein